ncbi:MAG: APC family permease [Caldilinea sp.]|nr:APC family permease [Caldilineaceae bacterium]MCW5843921.1 APC family permease [Caldilinea sp.]
MGNLLLGRRLATEEAPHQTISKTIGLAVFASDALSSVAYATQEILIILSAAGAAYFGLSIPIAIIIIGLLVVLTISYRQTIYAYPGGGGAYIVARDNLGDGPALTAGAALLTDYILTVSVSISSGVAQIASAFPAVFPYRVELALALIALITIVNLRGVKESGTVFAVPTYFFVVSMLGMLAFGFWQQSTGSLGTVASTEVFEQTTQTLTVFLLLKAFASGCTALTGVEAISNGIMAFKEPRSRNAAQTLMVMSALLGVMFIGITVLANHVQVVAGEGMQETVISQIARTLYGTSPLYYVTLAATTVILIMAANTSYADFPRLGALIAADGFLPKQLTYRGRRLVFSWGIVALALAASVLIMIFQADTTRLIPLYAIGVFLSFTLSQSGMVMRWRRSGKMKPGEEVEIHGSILRFDSHWRTKQAVNAFGAIMTFIVMIIFAVAKFTDGAYIVVVVIPLLVLVFFRIHRHYKSVSALLSRGARWPNMRQRPVKTLVLVDDVHAGTVHTINFAKSLGAPWTAVHVAIDPEKAERVKRTWQERVGDEAYLKVLPSPYRELTGPVHAYIEELMEELGGGYIHVIVGHLVMGSLTGQALHQNAAVALNFALQDIERVAVTTVAYQLDAETVVEAQADKQGLLSR